LSEHVDKIVAMMEIMG